MPLPPHPPPLLPAAIIGSGSGGLPAIPAAESDPGLGTAWAWLSASGLGLSYLGGFALLMFAHFDDHLKLDIKRELLRVHEHGRRRARDRGVLPGTRERKKP